MIILFIILLLILVLIFLAFTIPVRTTIQVNSETMDAHITMKWLPLMKIEAKTVDYKIFMSVYLLGVKIISKYLKKKKRNANLGLMIRSLSINDIRVRTYYGLNEPILTGIICAALNFIGLLVEVESLEQYPNFIPENEYLQIDASCDLNIGKTARNYIKLKSGKRKRIETYG